MKNNSLSQPMKECILSPLLPVSYLPGKRMDFTLIELLIVIAIIAILAGMLMPALNSAREKARSISCINKLKQLHLQFVLYTDTYNSCVPYYASTTDSTHLKLANFMNQKYDTSDGLAYNKYFTCPSDQKEVKKPYGGYATNPIGKIKTADIKNPKMIIWVDGHHFRIEYYELAYAVGDEKRALRYRHGRDDGIYSALKTAGTSINFVCWDGRAISSKEQIATGWSDRNTNKNRFWWMLDSQ